MSHEPVAADHIFDAEISQRLPLDSEITRALGIWRYSHPSWFVKVKFVFDSVFFDDATIVPEYPFTVGISDQLRLDQHAFQQAFREWLLFDYIDDNGITIAESMALNDATLLDWAQNQRYSRFKATSADRNQGTIQATDVFSGEEMTIQDDLFSRKDNATVGTVGMRVTKVGDTWHCIGISFHDIAEQGAKAYGTSFVDELWYVSTMPSIRRVITDEAS